jgi:hypothetical protein
LGGNTVIRNIFKRFKPDAPVRRVCNIRDANFMRNIWNDIQGIGCRVVVPEDKGGLGVRIIVDGSTDIDYPDTSMNPYGSGGETLQFPFKVTVAGDTATIDSGYAHVFNQEVNVAQKTFSPGSGWPSYINLRLTMRQDTADSVYDVGEIITADTYEPRYTGGSLRQNRAQFSGAIDGMDGTYWWWPIAHVDTNGGVTQMHFGELYDRNLPAGLAPQFSDYYEVAQWNADGYPHMDKVRMQ